ncbi:MAG: hypothetical protein R2699_18295 [Acidimicrobiales bacterium]
MTGNRTTSSPSISICVVSSTSWWIRVGTRPSAVATRGGSGRTSKKLPPEHHNTSSSPRSAASSISAAVNPGASGTGKPHCAASAAACSASTGAPPGSAVA